jgi:hypothetical protein
MSVIGSTAKVNLRACAPGSATQELRGLGLANLVGAAFNCYTTTGSFSRSAVMNDVGAKTQLAGVTSGARARTCMHACSCRRVLCNALLLCTHQGEALFAAGQVQS